MESNHELLRVHAAIVSRPFQETAVEFESTIARLTGEGFNQAKLSRLNFLKANAKKPRFFRSRALSVYFTQRQKPGYLLGSGLFSLTLLFKLHKIVRLLIRKF